MGNLIDLAERLETWKTVYDDRINVAVSSRGRFRFVSNGKVTCLDMVDAVTLLSSLSKELEVQMGVMFEDEVAPVISLK